MKFGVPMLPRLASEGRTRTWSTVAHSREVHDAQVGTLSYQLMGERSTVIRIENCHRRIQSSDIAIAIFR
jgi:hypothetical protein